MLRSLGFALTLGTAARCVAPTQLNRAWSSAINTTPVILRRPPRRLRRQRELVAAMERDYHRNQCWPEPFIAGDRAAVIVPFQIMADNAWQRQNLLCDYHFVEGTSELNNAGQYRLRWIIAKAPPQRRRGLRRTVDERKGDGRSAGGRCKRPSMRMAPDIPAAGLRIEPGPGQLAGRGRRRDAA